MSATNIPSRWHNMPFATKLKLANDILLNIVIDNEFNKLQNFYKIRIKKCIALFYDMNLKTRNKEQEMMESSDVGA